MDIEQAERDVQDSIEREAYRWDYAYTGVFTFCALLVSVVIDVPLNRDSLIELLLMAFFLVMGSITLHRAMMRHHDHLKRIKERDHSD